MKLLEKLLYASITFIFVYVVVSIALRMFELTTSYNSHMIGGIVATVVAMILFMFLLLRKKK